MINNEELKRVFETEFLGIKLHPNLSWKPHIDFLINKLCKYRNILYLTRNYFDRSSLLKLYHAFVYSSLSYCNIIWGNTYKTHLNKLLSTQKSILRTICYRKKCDQTNADFVNLNILKLPEINTYFSMIFT